MSGLSRRQGHAVPVTRKVQRVSVLQALIVEEYQDAVPSLENGRHNAEPAGWASMYVRLRSRNLEILYMKYCILVKSIGFKNSADLSHDLIATGILPRATAIFGYRPNSFFCGIVPLAQQSPEFSSQIPLIMNRRTRHACYAVVHQRDVDLLGLFEAPSKLPYELRSAVLMASRLAPSSAS